MLRSLVLSSPLILAATFAQAVDALPAMTAFVESDVMTWAHDPVLISAIKEQNAETAGLSEEQILDLDATWRAQLGTDDTPLIDEVVNNDAAAFLKVKMAESGGRITELFIVDALGLNVAGSDVTTDYWQGDEEKYSNTYTVGSGAIFVDEVEFDESSQVYQGQISIALTDPRTGEVIGVMTIGLNAEAFF